MEYQSLKALYYQNHNNPNKFEEIYQARLNNVVAVKTGLFVHPYDKKRESRLRQLYEIFYLPNGELSSLIEEVFGNTQKIERIRLKLPKVAEMQLFMTNLVNELQSTNEIEGVRSTKKEINEVMGQIVRKTYKTERFRGLVSQYLNLQNGSNLKIDSTEDFRTIWDGLLSVSEVEDQPDGELFRKDPVFITDGQKRIHEGDISEEQIKKDLQDLVNELNNTEIPAIPRYLIAHYFYEYVHPFYDGNGRTGRYILCAYLSQILDPLSAITFSSTIAKKKSSYYKAFTEMSNEHNCGEATLLIIRLLDILRKGQIDLLDAMKRDVELLNQASDIIKSLDITKLESRIMFVYYQQYIFGTDLEKITDSELAHNLKTTRYLLNQAIESLLKKGYIIELKKSPKIHELNESSKDKLKA